MNSFRIGAIGVLVDNWGISMAEGFLHDFEGWIIFMACAFILFSLVWLLEKLTNKDVSLAKVFGVVSVPENVELADTRSSKDSVFALVISIAFLLGALIASDFVDNREEEYPEHTSFVNFPTQLGQWEGRHERMEQDVIDKLKMTDYLFLNYANAKNERINLYVAYYQTQRKGISPHSPRVCIPGGGWEIADLQRVTVNGHRANRVIIKKGLQRQLVYYWFQGHGRIVANEYLNKWYLLQDALFKNRTDGALVRIVTPVFERELLESADARILDFMKKSDRELVNYIKD